MKFNVEKFKQISRPMNDKEREEIDYRNENREWLALSSKFALLIRHILKTEKITQSELASKMKVSPGQVSKILSGKENLGLQTISKIEKALGRSLISFCAEKRPDTDNLNRSNDYSLSIAYLDNESRSTVPAMICGEPGNSYSSTQSD